MAQAEALRADTIRVVRETDILWRLEGERYQTLVGILVSTEHLTVGRLRLLPGQRTDVQIHGGDESLYVLEGCLNVRIRETSGPGWFELGQGDGFFLPEGTLHQYYNLSDQPAELIFGVAPCYLPGD
jgi:quercetin dioxygenase-like cupin family protein